MTEHDQCLPACVPFIERLVDGVRPDDDAELLAHVRGCLPCYRASIDLGSVAAIGATLHATPPVDPGDLFFASFTRRVADAWTAPGARRDRRTGSARNMVPSAVAVFGAALAAAAWLFVPGLRPASRNDANPSRLGDTAQISSPAVDEPLDDLAELGADSPVPLDPVAEIEDLDSSALGQLAADIADDDLAEADSPVAGLSATESLELLGTPALAILSESLHSVNEP